MPLKCKFGIPKNGWLTITIISEETEYSCTASHIPNDSIGMLIKSISDLIDGIDSVTKWWLEPEIHNFVFTYYEERVIFQVINVSRNSGGITKQIYEYTGAPREIILPFWRALKTLSIQTWHNKDWHYPFPKDEMERLNRKIEVFKLKHS